MSTLIDRIGEYAGTPQVADIDAHVADYAKRILFDGLACAYGGLHSPRHELWAKALQNWIAVHRPR